MAKDSTTGPVSNPEGGYYPSSEEVRMTDEGLTRSEVINEFGEALGNMLLEGGYSSLSAILEATDEDLLAIEGLGPAKLKTIREKTTLVVEEEAPEPEPEVVEEEVPAEEDDILPELADLEVGPVEFPSSPLSEGEDYAPEVSVRIQRIRDSQES